MLWLSEILLQHQDLDSFEDLVAVVRERACQGEIFFRIDVRPPYRDTPANWEEQLETAFSGRID
ncbi:MAG: sulfur relay protein DsrC [Gammaproteobacteria bacterium]|nr:sulfur relay protein DsrC [Gammaproteobacteria bacterium]NIR81665.1 sulfur relay protein DsrC [Gammaproteobacteria bacterium]NIU02699.1 sulfur relay protein DsrC [Gammaproteobacteria bacterium]NIV73401.1 sulfur relay protein DsrC [Gammaproteobacteria bacterium]NIX83974.1 sulfur relay protein DsrC [Gammaproteobacteria bacterium]